uniref:Uncharacterized protein n=1 Tax=Panagrolaimus sp. PS1159 TaxID=55785 RepID=A0AC35FHH3_9BILA
MFVAPVTHISVFDKTLFVSTLLINAFQKWVFESIEVHMEMCEEFNHAKHMCKTYINYTTSTKDLSHPKQELYASTNYLDPLTYTITMELFFACIALLFHFSHHEESHKDNRTVKETVELKTGLLLAIIHMGPVIFVWPGYPSHQWERQGFRIAAYGLNSILTCWIIRYLHNPNEERFITVILNCFKKMDPDILILWISWIINVLLFIVKISIEYEYLYDTLESFEKPIYIVSQLGNIFEILSYILLIFLVGKLINYAEKASSNSMNNFVENHVLKSLHYNLEKIQDEDALNLLILIQSTYPSTLLFNMTLCLCFASIAETLFKKGFYQFAKRKNFEFILPNFDGWLEIDVGEIEEHDYLTVVFHGIEYKNSKPKKVEIIFAFVKTTDENDIKKSDEILWKDLKKAAKILGIDEKQLKKMHVVIDKEKPLLIKIKSYFNNTQELYFLTHWLDNIVKANKNEKEKCVGDKQPYSEMQWLSLLKQLSESDEINENTEIIQRTINALSHFKTLRSSTSQETEATVLTTEKLDRRNDEKSQKAKIWKVQKKV